MPYVERLKELKDKSKLTNAEIAKLSDLPLTTVTRVFNGSTPNPTFETFSHIATALGVSLDEIVGLKSPEEKPLDAQVGNTLSNYADLLREKDERIKDLQKDNKVLRRERIALAIFSAVIVAVVLLVIVLDVLNGHFGYFLY